MAVQVVAVAAVALLRGRVADTAGRGCTRQEVAGSVLPSLASPLKRWQSRQGSGGSRSTTRNQTSVRKKHGWR